MLVESQTIVIKRAFALLFIQMAVAACRAISLTPDPYSTECLNGWPGPVHASLSLCVSLCSATLFIASSLLYCSFLAATALTSSRVVVCMKNCRSKNLSTSSTRLKTTLAWASQHGRWRVDLHDRRTDDEHGLPLSPVERQDRKQALEERRVQQGEVEGHGQCNGIDEHHVLPQGQREQGLAR